jgi:hypothetical protein
MSLYGFQLVIRKLGMKRPQVFTFYVPIKNFHSRDVMENWVSSINGVVKGYQKKPRRKGKNRPDFWCNGEYKASHKRGYSKLGTASSQIKPKPKHWTAEDHPSRVTRENNLKAVPTIEQILSLEPSQYAQ